MEDQNLAVKNTTDDVTGPEESAAAENDTSQPTEPDLESTNDLDDEDGAFADLENLEMPVDETNDDDKSQTEEPTETPKPDNETQQASGNTEQPAGGREARLEKLTQEISDLRAQVGIEPNADIRAAVKERNLLKEIASNDIRARELKLEQEILGMVNPDTGENYTPTEATTIARTAAVNAESTQLQAQQRGLTIERNQSLIQREVLTTMAQMPIFQEKLPDGKKNPAYNEKAANLAGERLFDAYITEPVLNAQGQQLVDKSGQPVTRIVGIKRSPAEILKSVATTLEDVRKSAAVTGAASANSQAVNADVPLSSRNSAGRKDPDFEAFDDVINEEY